MNVVRAPVSNNAEPLNLTGRQDRNASGKNDSSGFAQTLGAVDKAEASKQKAPSASADAAATQTTAGNQPGTPGVSTAANTTLGAQAGTVQQPVVTVSDFTAPVLPDLNQIANAALDTVASPPVEDAQLVAQPLDLEAMTETPEGLKDLAELVHALTKATSEPVGEKKDADPADGDVVEDDQATDGNLPADADILTLLAANAALNNQSNEMPAPPPQAHVAVKLTGTDAAGAVRDEVLDAPRGGSSTTVRLEKQDVPGIDLHIDTNEDGSMKVDASVASGNATNVVQVVESRRYIGLAPSSNAASITAAMTSDPDWSSALTGQATGKPMITSTGQVVHTLKIQMNPVEMGHVTAAMKLVGDQLSVHLTAHTLKGYAELQKDSSAILESLKAQGFTVEQVTVSLANGPERQENTAGNKQQQQPDQGQQMGAQGNQRGQEERSQEQFYRQPHNVTNEDLTSHDNSIQPAPVAGSADPRSGQLYL